MNKKSIGLFLIVIILVALPILVKYLITYSTHDSKSSIEKSMHKFLSKGNSEVDNVSIKYSIDIGNKRYILFTFDNRLAFGELHRGINKKYKVYSAQYGQGRFRSEVVSTKDGKFLVAYGENNNLEIDTVRVTINGKKYKLNIPKEKYYISYCTVDSTSDIGVVVPKIFDANDNDITDKIL